MRRRSRAFLLSLALAALLPDSAWAQAVDYGTLQQIFGEPVTTSVTGKPQRASDAPGDLIIITQDQIRRSGADNVPDILQFVTGIDVRRYSFGDSEVAVRGYGTSINPRLLVLVDGRQIYSDDYGYVAWNALPVQLSEIQQIEVVRGPATALFGFNAASGVVNIITCDPLFENRNGVTVRGGTQDFGEGEAVVTQHLGSNAGVRVSVGGWTTRGFYVQDGGTMPATRYGNVDMEGRWQVTSDLLLSASGGVTDRTNIREITVPVPFHTHTEFERFSTIAQTPLGTMSLDGYRNKVIDSNVTTTVVNTLYVLQASDLVKPDADDTFRVALQYHTDAIALPGRPGSTSYDLAAVNGMWDRQISSAVDINNAARLDYLALHFSGPLVPGPGRSPDAFRTSLSAVSFNSGLVVHFSDMDTARLTLSRGLQLPSLEDFGLQLNLPQFAILGVPSLRPESVWHAELAYERTLPAWRGTMRLATFFQRNTDLILSPGVGGFQSIAGRLTSEAANIGSSNEIGAEIELRGQTDSNVRWQASYRYTSITDDVTHTLLPSAESAYASGTPRHVVILGLGYSIGRWEFDAQARLQTQFTDFDQTPLDNFKGTSLPVKIPAYATANGRVGFRATNYLTLAGTVEQANALHELRAAGSYVDRRFIASATLKY